MCWLRFGKGVEEIDLAVRVMRVAEELGARSHRYHRMTLGPGESWAFPEHTHDACCDISFIVRGTVTEVVNGAPLSLGAGDLAWIRRRDVHSLRMTDADFINLDLREGDFLRVARGLMTGGRLGVMHEAEQPPVVTVAPAERASLMALFEALFLAGREDGSLGALDRLLVRLYTELTAAPVAGRADAESLPAWLLEALPEVERRLEQGVTVPQLVAFCDRTPEHVARSFGRHLGTTPSQYLNDKKLTRAALLLAHTNRSIKDIALTLGFGSANYFHRRFKEAHGKTPAQYRQGANRIFPGQVPDS